MDEPLYDTLRTKEQLGYSVSCGLRMTNGILGFAIRVQSERYVTVYLHPLSLTHSWQFFFFFLFFFVLCLFSSFFSLFFFFPCSSLTPAMHNHNTPAPPIYASFLCLSHTMCRYEPPHLHARVEEFLRKFHGTLASMTDKEYYRYVQDVSL